MHPPSSAAVSTSTIPGVLDIFFEIFLEASSIAATPAFMSDDPRPYSRSPCVSPANGSRVHALTPSGTTSRWPVRQSGAFEGDPPARAITLVRASAYSWYSTRKPHCSRSAPACRAQSRSRPGGLTVAKRSSERVRAMASCSLMRTDDTSPILLTGFKRTHSRPRRPRAQGLGATLNASWRSAMPSSIRYFPLLLALAALPASAQTVRVYVTNSAGDSIHVIDPATNKVVQVINGVEAAHGIDFSPDGQRVYVSNEADSTLDVIDRASGKTIAKVRLSGHPNNISATKDGGRVVVGIAESPGALDVIDARALKLARTIPVNGRLHNVYVTPDNKYVVTGSIRSKVLTVIDLKTDQIAWELKLDEGVRPMTMEVNPDGSTRRIFAQLSNFNGFAVVDFAARKEA